MEQEELNHLNYQHTPNEKEADGIAYVFSGPDSMVRYPFKLPELNPNELRIKVTYTGLCHTDVQNMKGEWGQIFYPICPGHEIVGVVSEIGSEVKDFQIGDRVGYGPQRECCNCCNECEEGRDNCCLGDNLQMETYGDMYWGGYATIVQQPADFAFKLPPELKEETAPPLFCAGLSTYAPIARFCKPGDQVAVLGIGGLGHLAVQYAKAMGCKVVAFSSSREKDELIKELGAERVVSSGDLKALDKEKYSFNVVLNTVPVFDEKLFSAHIGLVKPNGHFVQIGLPAVETPLKIDPMLIVSKQIKLTGSYVGSRKEMKEMLEFSAKHGISPKCEVFEFDSFPKAFDKLVNGKPFFRCVVKCEGYFP
jgi:D-arabinose 1-dehydrogenase-like Zn-dependent alcohol dehydrogenase